MKLRHLGFRSTCAGCLVFAYQFFMLPSSLPAAVISQVYGVPLVVKISGASNPGLIGFIIDGKIYRFQLTPAPFDFDFDKNGSTDLTIGASGRSGPTSVMFVTQHGRNQVWSLAGGAAGFDFGSHALSLAAGTTLGPSLHHDSPYVGWHNDDDTRATSVIMEAEAGNPVSGTFFPRYLFEQRYLGFRFERNGAQHYGWMALSAYSNYGSEVFVYSWGYESEPDTPLIVGQIPEPTVHVLLAGVVWGAAMRRTRSRGGQGTG